MPPNAGSHWKHWPVALVIAFSTLYFTGAITYGNFHLFAWEDVGVFYDYQADSLLHGHWDVPDAAIHNEAFIVDGKSYGYFGPTPALLRLPIIAFHPEFGHLTRIFMLVYFVLSLVAGYALLRDAVALCAPTGARVPRTGNLAETAIPLPSAWATSVLLASAGLGSPLLFLAGRPMMYHEAIACGAVFALWSARCTLRYLRGARQRYAVLALVLSTLAVNARPTAGLFALTMLGCAALLRALRAWKDISTPRHSLSRRIYSPPLRRHLAIAALCGPALLTVNAVAYFKFGTFDSVPLQLSRPYTGNDRYPRVDNQKFHLVNIPWGLDCYFLTANCRFDTKFPYLVMGYRNSATDHPNAKIDLPDFTIAAPYSMTSLFALAVFGGAIAAVRHRASRGSLFVIAIGLVATTFVLCTFIAVAQRYSADLCAGFICAAAFGAAAIDVATGRSWRFLRTAWVPLSVASALVSAAILFDYQTNWGPLRPEVQQRYRATRDRITQAFHLK